MALELLVPSGFTARQAKANLIVNGVNVLGAIPSERVLSFTYEDNTSNKADSIKFAVEDKDRSWMSMGMPRGGQEVKAGIDITNWQQPFDDRSLDCGSFWIDEIDCSGPPNCITLKGNSAPVTTGIKDTKKNRGWEGADIQTIGRKIAETNGLTFVYDVRTPPQKTKRTDQCDKSDMEYFAGLCKEVGLAMKIHNKQLIVYSEKEYEEREPSFTFVYGASNILSWSFALRHADVYAEATESYVNPETGKLTKVKVKGKKVPKTKSKLNLNEGLNYGANETLGGNASILLNSELSDWKNDDPVANKGKGAKAKKAAKGKAAKKLKDKNKKHKTSSLTVVGDLMYLSGLTCLVQGFGEFDDKYFIEGVCHDIGGSGYTCKLAIRWAIGSYDDDPADFDPDPDWLYTDVIGEVE